MEGWVNRRTLLHLGGYSLIATVAGLSWNPLPAQAKEVTTGKPSPIKTAPVDPDAALQQLLQGNRRFTQHKPQYPHQSRGRLQEVAYAQTPFATILSCADSRVPAEILFDVGIGDLFDIRVAGNVVSPEVLGSLEYAAAVLNTSLILVLGHERCGAVTAAVKGESLPGSMGSFVKAIKPAIAKSTKLASSSLEDQIDQAVVANVSYQLAKIQRNSNLIAQQVLSGDLKLVGGRYDLDTGEVTILT
jgi:carbonic anhydrase